MSVATGLVHRQQGLVGKTWALVRKDIRIELRARETLPAMVAFSFAVMLLLAFTLPPTAELRQQVIVGAGTVALSQVLSGFLWVTILFAGLIGFARTFEIERAEGALDPLLMAPLDRSGLFAAKAVTNLLLLFALQVFLVPIFGLLFSVNLGARWFVLCAVMVLVDLGFVMVGTLFSALAAQTRSRELMLPILALPVLVPIFIAGTELTADLLAGGTLATVAARGWFGILIASDLLFAVVAGLAFEFAVER